MSKKIYVLLEKYNNMSSSLKAAFWFTVCSFLQRGITVVTTPIFTRLMNSAEFGQFSVFNSWLEIFIPIITLKISSGYYLKGLISFEEDRDNFTTSMLSLDMILIIFWLFIYILFQDYINKLLNIDTSMMLCLFILVTTGSWFEFWSAHKRVDFKYRNLIIVSLIVTFLKPTLGIIAVIFNPSIKVFARIMAIITVEFVIYFFLFIKEIKLSNVFFNKKYWIGALSFCIPLVPHYLSQTILNHSDRIMIQLINGETSAGIYSLAYSIAMIMILFNSSIQNSLSPWNYQQLKDKNYKSMKKVSSVVLCIIALLNLLLILIAPEVIAFFAPKSYQEAVYVIPLVAMGVYFMFMYGLFVNVEMYYEKTKYIMFSSVLSAIVNIILNIIFIRIFGYIAAAYTTLICYILYALFHGLCVTKIQRSILNGNSVYNYTFIIFISIIFILCGFIIMFFYNYTFIRYFIIFILIIIIFVYKKKIINLFGIIQNAKRRKTND